MGLVCCIASTAHIAFSAPDSDIELRRSRTADLVELDRKAAGLIRSLLAPAFDSRLPSDAVPPLSQAWPAFEQALARVCASPASAEAGSAPFAAACEATREIHDRLAPVIARFDG